MMEITGLSKSFNGKPAVADLSLRVEDNEYLTLLGPSGSGKTTLLRLLAGMERPETGRIAVDGEDITIKPTHMRGLGFVQQNYALFPHMTVEDNIAFGLRNRIVDPIADKGEVRRRVGDMLELVGLSDLGGRMVGQISGGQKQRVSLARTLVTEPRVCLLDEPLGALDANLRERMTIELRNIRKTLGVTFFHATGNESEAIAMGDRMIVLDRGGVAQIASPDVIFDTPSTIRVARFVNSYNILAGADDGGLFRYGETRFALPAWAQGAAFIAVRYDSPAIEPKNAAPAQKRVFINCSFVASEFIGNMVRYFFRTPNGDLLEVERHLSQSDPESFAAGHECLLTWNVAETLFFNAAGDRIDIERKKGAA